MSFAPLLHAGPLIATHAAAAFAALAIGGLQFASPKGTWGHRWLGWIWVLLLGFVAIGSFAIHTIRLWGPFSPIHILSIVTLVSLAMAIVFARAGKIEAHRQTMAWVYALALVVTGLFTLWPGRIMHQVLFGS